MPTGGVCQRHSDTGVLAALFPACYAQLTRTREKTPVGSQQSADRRTLDQNGDPMRLVFSCSLLSLLFCALPALGQDDDEDSDSDRFGLGLGVGLVDTAFENEFFFEAALRYRVTGCKNDDRKDDDRDDDDRKDDDCRDSREERAGEIDGYLELSVSEWSGSQVSDTRIGLDIVGVTTYRRVDYLYGAGLAIHFIDADGILDGVAISQSEGVAALNIHTGLDVYMSENVSVYGRFLLELFDDSNALDLASGVRGGDSEQLRISLGIRFHF